MKLALVMLAGCGAAAAPHTVSITAPSSAHWTSATVITHYSETTIKSSMIGTNFTLPETGIELVVRAGDAGHSTPLFDIPTDTLGLPEMTSAEDLAKIQFQLAASPDGTWLAVSADRGATWLAVDPESLMTCQHLALHGAPSTFWARMPSPRQLALAIMKGGHAGESALPWVATHVDDPSVLPMVTELFFAQSDERDADSTLLEKMKTVPKATLLHGLEHASAHHMRVASQLAELLWREPETQAALAGWITSAMAPDGPTIFDTKLVGDWEFTRDVWDLARLVERDHATPEAEQAAIAVIVKLSQLLPSAEERERAAALGTRGHPWGMVRWVSAEAAVTYAIQILVAAHSDAGRAAIAAADFDRKAWAPVAVRYTDPIKDYQVDSSAYSTADVDAWFVWASSRLAKP